MSLVQLRAELLAAAQSEPLGLHPFETEDEALLLDAFVIGWPTRLARADFGGGWDIELPMLVLVAVQSGEAVSRLDALMDGPLIGTLESAAHGGAIEVRQVTPVIVNGATALRLPLILTTTV
jgi:hypothetical protein